MMERACYCIWILVHFLYLLAQEWIEYVFVVWNQCSRRLSSCWPQRSAIADCSTIIKYSQGLKKLPNHVAFLIVPEDADSSQIGILQKLKFIMTRHRRDWTERSSRKKHLIDVTVLSKLVTWSWAANIPLITLYDYYGEIKDFKEDLMYSILDEMETNLWAIQKVRTSAQIPKLCIYDAQDADILTNKMSNGRTDFKSMDTITILLTSVNDGRARIVETAKRICTERTKLKNVDGISKSLVTEADIDHQLNLLKVIGSSISADPDVLVMSGNVKSTLGFLPWNIRLSEMHWVPKLNLVDSSHFLNVLAAFSGCQQRFGK